MNRRKFIQTTAAAGALGLSDLGLDISPAAAQDGATGTAGKVDPKPLTLRPAEMPLSSLFPNTTFFEVDSASVNSKFGIWVTTPPGYNPNGTERYPAIFTPDGNLFAPLTIPFVAELSAHELIYPIKPYIQVTVGYCGAEGDEMLATRARDLLPPGEPTPKHLLDGMDAAIASGMPQAAMYARYKANLLAPHGDAFLRFLTTELYPAITAQWRVDPKTTGFFGDSYGGLFAVWLALQRVEQFPFVGAGSPGMLSSESKIFDLLEREISSGADHAGRHLHLSICEPEFSEPTLYQMLAEQYARFLRIVGQRPLKGLKLTAHTVPFESHMTGAMSNFFSFLRTCYSAPRAT
jgi:hypothetical protein